MRQVSIFGDGFTFWTKENAYVLGLFAADGNININKNGSHYVEFTSADKDHLEKIGETLRVKNRIGMRLRFSKTWNPTYRLQIGSKDLVQKLQGIGFTVKKSHRLHLPGIPDGVFPDFVRGYFDGDGYVLFKSYERRNRPGRLAIWRTVFTSASQTFLAALHDRLKMHARIQHGALRREAGYFILVYAAKSSHRLFEFMYNGVSNSKGLLLSRKYLVFKEAYEFWRGRGVAA